MGNTCKPMAVSFQCMTKSTTIKKKKKKAKLDIFILLRNKTIKLYDRVLLHLIFILFN